MGLSLEILSVKPWLPLTHLTGICGVPEECRSRLVPRPRLPLPEAWNTRVCSKPSLVRLGTLPLPGF